MNIANVCTLRGGEHVVRIIRQHPAPHLRSALLPALLILASFFFMLPLFSFGRAGVAVFGISIAFGLLLAARIAYRWHWNSFIVTDRRIIDVDQRGFFDRVVSEVGFERITDVAYRMRGLAGHVFRYGTVTVRTQGAGANLELSHIPHPENVHELIAGMLGSVHLESVPDAPKDPDRFVREVYGDGLDR